MTKEGFLSLYGIYISYKTLLRKETMSSFMHMTKTQTFLKLYQRKLSSQKLNDSGCDSTPHCPPSAKSFVSRTERSKNS